MPHARFGAYDAFGLRAQEVDVALLRDVEAPVGARGAAGGVVRQREERAAVDVAVQVQALRPDRETQDGAVGPDVLDLDAVVEHEGIAAIALEILFFQRLVVHHGASGNKNHADKYNREKEQKPALF